MLLSIVVLSYNRPTQIERILNNFIGFCDNRVQLIIKDDISPRIIEIEEIVNDYKKNKLDINLNLVSNKKNLGYDLNLLDSFWAVESDYIFLLSDDDFIRTEFLPDLLNLLSLKIYSVYFTPYFRNGVLNRYNISSYKFNNFVEVIYNSILFSGLIFETNSVKKLKLNRNFLVNSLYSQVFISALLIFQLQSFGVMPKNILFVGEDGENFFGKNESATNHNLLSDRTSITADLIYQSFLIEVVKEISNNTNSKIRTMFLIEYKKRLLGYIFRSRASGIRVYFNFVRAFLHSHAKNYHIHILFLFLMFFIPSKVTKYIYSYGVKNLRKSG
jgi:hypothetical protein